MPAFWVRARDGVSGAFWFGDFQHRTAHFALNFDGFRAGGFGCIGQGTTDFGGPAKGIGILVLLSAQLGLAQRKSHLALALAFFLCGSLRCHGTHDSAEHGCIQ